MSRGTKFVIVYLRIFSLALYIVYVFIALYIKPASWLLSNIIPTKQLQLLGQRKIISVTIKPSKFM